MPTNLDRASSRASATSRRSFNAINSVMLGDCIGLMRGLDAGSVDFILTDPPYLVSYRPRGTGAP